MTHTDQPQPHSLSSISMTSKWNEQCVVSARVRAWRRRLSVVVVVLSRATHDVCARTRAHSVAAFTVAVMAR